MIGKTLVALLIIGGALGVVAQSGGVSWVDILDLFSKLVLPFILGGMTLIARGFWKLHKRMERIEDNQTDMAKTQTKHDTTLYGSDDDTNIDGLTQDLAKIGEQVNRIEQAVTRIEREMNGDDHTLRQRDYEYENEDD